MPTVAQIVDFAKTVDAEGTIWCSNENGLLNEILSVNSDQDAVKGDLAWISPKNAKKDPKRLANFAGTLVVGPPVASQSVPLLGCTNPKLMFTRIVTQFFPELTTIYWPTSPQGVWSGSTIANGVELSTNVVIGSNTVIDAGVIIGPNTVIANAHIKRGVRIGANCTIGLPGFGYERDASGRYWRFPHIGGVVLEEGVEIGSNTCIDRGALGNTTIGQGTKIDNLVHIAHNVVIKANTVVIANSMIAGSVTLEENVWVAPSVSVLNQVKVGKAALLGIGTVVLKDVPDRNVMVGNPAKMIRQKEENE